MVRSIGRIDNAVTKRKGTKRQTMVEKHYIENQRLSIANPTKKTGVNSGAPEV